MGDGWQRRRQAGELWLPAGATYGEAARTILTATEATTPVLQIEADELSLLCRCVADLPEVHALNRRLPQALAMPY